MHTDICYLRRQGESARTAQRGRAENTAHVRSARPGLRRQHPAALFSYAGGFLVSAAAPVAAIIPWVLSGTVPPPALLMPLLPPVIYAAVCVLVWRRRLWAHRRVLTCCGGVLTRYAAVLKKGDISRVGLERTPVLGLCRAVRLNIAERSTGRRKRTLVLTAREGTQLARALTGCDQGGAQIRYDSSSGGAALAALTGSNFASGLLLFIPVVVRLGKIAGNALDRRLYEELGSTAAQLIPGLPSVYALAAGLLAAGYAAHFVSNFFSAARHRAYRGSGCTVIASGAVTRRVCMIPLDALSVIETRRTLLMCALSCSSCYVYTDSSRGAICLIMPQKNRRFTRIRAAFFPRPDYTGAVVRPDRAHLRLYSQSWYIFSFVTAAAWAVLDKSGQALAAPLLIPAVIFMWRALIGLTASRSAKMRVCAGFVELSGVGGLCARTWRINRQSISRITVRQSPFDLLRGTCTVVIHASGMRSPAKCSYLPYERALALCERLAQ